MLCAVVFGLVASNACANPSPARSSSTIVDDLGDSVRLEPARLRIVSLSPVSTEVLFALGAGARVVGRTHWDLYPSEARAVPDLGNGMQPNVEAVLGAHPDLVVLYASEGNRGAASRLRAAGASTLSLHMDRVSDLRRVAVLLARAVGDSMAGVRLADSVQRTLDHVRDLARQRVRDPAREGAAASPATPRVFWFIWESPLYTIGRGSFLSELVEIAGARNIFDDLEAAAPQVTLEEVVRRNPDIIITGPENARRIRQSAAWQTIPAVRRGRVLVVDTALVGRPGPRLGQAALHLRLLLHANAPVP